MTELESLRARLDVLDGRLLELAAERAQVVQSIGRAKQGGDGALFDRDRERRVLAQARDRSQALGLDPQLGEALLRVLVEGSHARQSDTLQSDIQRHFCIVGGEGRMGRRLGQAFEGRGHTVTTLEVGDPLDVGDAEVVMLAVPMAEQVRMAHALGPRLREGVLFCDINSLKEDITHAMHRSYDGEVLGLHPMFGPTVGTLRRQKVVLCSARGGALSAWMERELKSMGLETIVCSPSEHDRMMAVVQVLTHFSTLVMGEALRRNGVPVERSLQFTSPIYRLELAFTGRLFAQSADLYAEIEMSNPHGPEVRQHFREAAATVTALIEAGDRPGFRAMFDRIGDFFGGFDEEAMRLSDLVIDTLVARP